MGDGWFSNRSGKRALAIAAFSAALRALPTTIADNGGYDSAELVSMLRVEHHKGKPLRLLNYKLG